MTANLWHRSSAASWVLFFLMAAPAVAIEEEILLDLAPPVSGSLVICGGGDVPDSVMLRFVELAGGPSARIVFIPTAAEGADLDEADDDLEFFQHQRLASLCVLHTRSREQANDPDFLRPLHNATGVWLAGGCQRLLADVYHETAVEEALRRLFARGGAIGGISAGAAVMSPIMIRGGRREPETGPGFGLLPGTVIDQHFLKRGRQDRLLRVLAANPGLVGIGIDEGAALIVQGSRLTVMGDSCVVTCLAASADWREEVTILQPGEEADLSRLVRSAWMRSQPRPPATEKREPAALPTPTTLAAAIPTRSATSTRPANSPTTSAAKPRSAPPAARPGTSVATQKPATIRSAPPLIVRRATSDTPRWRLSGSSR